MRRSSLILSLLVLLARRVDAGAPQDVREQMPSGPLVAGQFELDDANGGEAIAASTPVKAVRIRSACSNQAILTIHVGGPTVNASSAKGWTLKACDELSVPVDNLADIYVDAGVTGADPAPLIEYIGVQGP